jgi:hypothetical protein
MTIPDAEKILDIVSAALQDIRHRHHPISSLKGYNILQICTALNLRIANEFLCLADRDDSESQFAEGLRLYGGIPGHIIRFAPDNQVEDIITTPVFTLDDLSPLETPESFGNYCKHIGANDPIYWQKVYTRIGLEYSSSSPRGNEPVI